MYVVECALFFRVYGVYGYLKDKCQQLHTRAGLRGIFCRQISPYAPGQEPATERHTGLWAEANPVHAPASLPLPTGLTSSNRAGWRPCELSIMQADRHARDLPGGPQSVQPHNRLTLRNGMGWR